MLQPWFTNAKLGIFIHWGIYSVGGLEASWSFFNHNRPGFAADDHLAYEDYMGQRHAFFANRYDPKAWVDLFAASGARYTTLVTKHHDGVALWDTSANDLSVVKATPARRDLVSPFCAAVRRRGMHLGHWYGPSTISTDRTCIYVTVFERPYSEFPVKGIRNRILRVSALGSEGALPHRVSGGALWAGIPGVLWITVPEAVCDPCGTVLKIELEGALDLYTGSGTVVTQN